MDAIGREMLLAMETDERMMWSALVHDQPQMVEVEELKTRLNARSKNEVEVLKTEQIKLNNLVVKVKNTENDIAGSDEQLSLEEGALMRHTRLDKPFRAVALCAANAAGNEVTGKHK